MRRARRKAANKEKVFGCDLLEHLATSCQEIPQVLRSCCEFVEEHGIVDGIYRLSGVSSNTQKLRGEFDSEGIPDLNKDVYLQDIHCVSSLCKAYFRELPNPLLTYQLYDMFAEAVALQLEEERLVKITDVLKELPPSHFRTLEFLMQHLVKMASHSSETNMHARNLAIVWAPNLLRSKDIEISGLNGTAAFMEVRVQSIVVEFILTHVPQLFPEEGGEKPVRRKSLPSPSAMSNSEFFRSMPLKSPNICNIGHISPGDGPLAMRPYHSIIEPTDKRKGSLKGRKWTSIFNLGGRLHDPRRRHKNSTKEKEKTSLRSAKSMDSLSCEPYPHEGSGQRSPSSHISPLAMTPCPTGGELGASGGGGGGGGGIGNSYAVTYRRGAGASVSVVSGGGGMQGTYSLLDPGGTGATGSGAESLQTLSRSPGLSSKAGRRAGIHISGPLSVTVPLHITSGLAFGVLQGGGGDMGIHRGPQGGGDRSDGVEEVGGEKQEKGGAGATMYESVEREDVREAESEGGKSAEEEEVKGEKVRDGIVEEKRDEKVETAVEKMESEEEALVEGETKLSEDESCDEPGGQGADNLNSSQEKDVEDEEGEYMDMKGSLQAEGVSEAPVKTDTTVSDASGDDDPADVQKTLEGSDVSDPSEDDELPLDFQDTFGFLDLMDSSASNQMNEFSVEPPCYEDEEYEDMVEHVPLSVNQHTPNWNAQPPANTQRHTIGDPQAFTDANTRQTQMNLHRPLTLNQYGRANKSLSLPYRTAPILPALSSSSDEEDDDDDDEYEEETDMFYRSLPSSLQFRNHLMCGMTHAAPENVLALPTAMSQESDCPLVHMDQSQSSEPALCWDPPMDTLEQSQAEGEDGPEEDEDEGEDEDTQEDDKEDTLTVTHTQSTETEDVCHPRTTEEDEALGDTDESLTSVSSTTDCTEARLSASPDPEEVDAAQFQVKDKEETAVENHHQVEGEFPEGHRTDAAIAADISEAHGLQVCHASSWAAEPEAESNLEEDTGERVMRNTEDKMVAGGNGEIASDEEREIVKEMGERKEDGGEVEERDRGEPTEGEEERVAEEGDEEAEKGEEQVEAACGDTSLEVSDGTGEVAANGESTDEEQVGRESETEGRGIRQEAVEVNEERERVAGENGGTTEELEEECSATDEEQMEDTFIENEREKQSVQPQLVPESDQVDPIQEDEAEEDVTEDDGVAVSHVTEDAGARPPTLPNETEESHSKEHDTEEDEREKGRNEGRQMQTILEEREEEPKEMTPTDTKEGGDVKAGLVGKTGVGRMLVVSGQTALKVHQVKSVPVVPPKPQHCRLTALSIRHQQQQEREKREADREKERGKREADRGQERPQRVQEEQRKVEREAEGRAEDDKLSESEQGGQGGQGEGEGGGKGRKERPEGERERRRDGDEGGAREMAKSSPISMCFDEAVAMATIRRGREKESAERERQRERGPEAQ